MLSWSSSSPRLRLAHMPFSLGDRCAGPSPLPSPASRARANNSFNQPYRIPSPHWLFALARRQAGEGKGG
jgi:hypothetical protein